MNIGRSCSAVARRTLASLVLTLGIAACSGGDVTPPRPQSLAVAAAGEGSGTVTSEPAGIDCRVESGVASGACTATFPASATVSLRFTAGALSAFGGWSGACAEAAACSLTLDQSRTVTATFRRLPPQALTITGGGTGSGTVTSQPAGLACTVESGGHRGGCSGAFDAGTVVTLQATPDSLSDFAGWSGGCTGMQDCRVTLAQAASVAATFQRRPPQQVVVSGAGTGSGSIVSEPAGISCAVDAGATTGTCAAAFDVGTAVTLRASAGARSDFAGWSGACSGSACQLSTTAPRAATATFERRPAHAVTIAAAGRGSGSVTSSPAGISCTIAGGVASGACSASFDVGTTVALEATAAGTLSAFTGWSGACSGTTCQLTVAAPTSVTAGFAGPTVTVIARDIATAGPALGNGTVTLAPGVTCAIENNRVVGTCSIELRPGEPYVVTIDPAATEAGVVFHEPPGGTLPTPCQLASPSFRFTCAATPAVRATEIRVVMFRAFVGLRTQFTASSGFGRVTSDVGGINCRVVAGASATGVCAADVGGAQRVVLSFTPEAGTTFQNWAGDCGLVTTATCTLTMDVARRTFLVNSTAAPAGTP
ncbi:MAG TPA: hypothetical protein VEZ47_08440 [Gemmatirosa sp.]|nr:hypothetical protein [Gemmatirosa sp.]